jgi:hypothetical protein
MDPKALAVRLDLPLRVSSPFSAELGCRLSHIREVSKQILQSLDNSFLEVDRATSSGGLAVRNKAGEASCFIAPQPPDGRSHPGFH